MLVIPAVDIFEGKVVRLRQGDPERKEVFSDDPVEAACYWKDQGASLLHIVDLDGTLEGRPKNGPIVQRIIKESEVPIQLGGGIRGLEVLEDYINAGVHRVFLGTLAVERPDLVEVACKRWPGRIAVAIDARQGKVSIEGWKRQTPYDAVELARMFDRMGVAALLYTDVDRDGMSTGVNVMNTVEVAKAVNTPVIASGGVATLEDILCLARHAHNGIEGVIVGRALYEERFSLREALAIARESKDGSKIH